jgi:hypothetical protein
MVEGHTFMFGLDATSFNPEPTATEAAIPSSVAVGSGLNYPKRLA